MGQSALSPIYAVSQLHLVMARLCLARKKPRHAACAYLLWCSGGEAKKDVLLGGG